MRPPVGPTVTFFVNANNLLNNVQYQNFNGVLGANSLLAPVNPLFGKPTSARNGRSLNLGVRFNF